MEDRARPEILTAAACPCSARSGTWQPCRWCVGGSRTSSSGGRGSGSAPRRVVENAYRKNDRRRSFLIQQLEKMQMKQGCNHLVAFELGPYTIKTNIANL